MYPPVFSDQWCKWSPAHSQFCVPRPCRPFLCSVVLCLSPIPFPLFPSSLSSHLFPELLILSNILGHFFKAFLKFSLLPLTNWRYVTSSMPSIFSRWFTSSTCHSWLGDTAVLQSVPVCWLISCWDKEYKWPSSTNKCCSFNKSTMVVYMQSLISPRIVGTRHPSNLYLSAKQILN